MNSDTVGGEVRQKPVNAMVGTRDRTERFEAAGLHEIDRALENVGKTISKYTDRITPGFLKRWQNAKVFDLTMREGEA